MRVADLGFRVFWDGTMNGTRKSRAELLEARAAGVHGPPCPFCGSPSVGECSPAALPQGRLCDDCGIELRYPADRCGFCEKARAA